MSSEVTTNCTVRPAVQFLSFIHSPSRVWHLPTVPTVDTIRLLIVDKNTKVRQALEARLGSSDWIEVVGTARGSAEGVRLYPQLKPDVTLLDAKTAGRPEEVAEVVRDLAQQGSTVIVLTSYAFEAEREAALDSGAAQYLLKDIDSTALIREIESIGRTSVNQAKG